MAPSSSQHGRSGWATSSGDEGGRSVGELGNVHVSRNRVSAENRFVSQSNFCVVALSSRVLWLPALVLKCDLRNIVREHASLIGENESGGTH